MLTRALHICALALVCAASMVSAAVHAQTTSVAASLPPPVQLALDRARIPAAAVSVWVQAVDGAQPAYALNSTRAMNPASVMKLVTAFAALDRLGPAHTWSTRVATTGAVREHVLDGNLYLIGSGDPVLNQDRITHLLRRVRGFGIDRVGGDIVLDASALRLPAHDPNAFDGRGVRPYNSGPYGLLMHYNTLQLQLFPGRSGADAVVVAPEQTLAGIEVDNQLRTSDAPCTLWHRDLEARVDSGHRLVLSGSLPAQCGPRTWAAAPLSPAEYSLALTASLWSAVGGRIEGRVRDGSAPMEALTRFEDESPPLAEIVRDMNKWSSNVIARQLLATLGATGSTLAADAPDMVAGGAQLAREQLRANGVEVSGLVIENGSGLSRNERIRADSLGQLLLAAWKKPWMPEYIAALPMAGVDGTARRRLRDSPANGQAHVKTGTLDGVRAIAGYVLDRNGRRHAVVMMVNHPEAAASAAAQDALLEWVWAGAR